MGDVYLILRFDAPLMSFGGPAVDQERVTADWPARSMLTGLLGNALGWSHGNSTRLQELQERIVFAARRDRAGERHVDYQTVDLGQEFLVDTGWTTSGEAEGREGGPVARLGTHIRRRHYLADAVYTVVMRLDPPAPGPTLEDLEAALQNPARPLFIGRKACLPSVPILAGRTPECASALEAILSVRACAGRADLGPAVVLWPDDGRQLHPASRVTYVTDDRDWANQIHCGRRRMVEGMFFRVEESTS